ncbi:MAG TPA: hypothetical protein VHL58_04530 [Thermoanaerobaculia bacterium]|nr:hypothetical protein [Thermoanaerobaculia bacterium]
MTSVPEAEAGDSVFLPERAAVTVSVATIVATVMLFHISALNGWWLADDPQILLQARHSSLRQIFFSPHHWRVLSSSNFTPLVTLSFKVDLALFGLDARWFFAHQLIALALAATLLFFLVRRYAGILIGTIAAVLFVISPQAILLSRFLMLRHYLEGLCFALAALLVWDGRPWKRWAALVAALLYLAALCAKEVYAPLPILFLVMSLRRGDRPRQIVRDLIPAAAVAVVYIVWRGWMLGSAGGYGGISVAALSRLPMVVASAAFGHQRWEIVIVLCVALALLIESLLAAPKRGAVLLIGTAVMVMLPLIPVAAQFENRYALVAFVSLLVLGACAAASAPWRVARYLYALLFFPLLAGGQNQRVTAEGQSQLMIGEGRYVSERPASSPTLLAQSPGWYLEGLTDLRREMKGESAPSILLSVYPLYLAGNHEGVVQCIADCREVAPISDALREEGARKGKGFRSDLPMRVRIEKKGDDFYWDLAPNDGGWVFLSFPDYDEFPIPASGWRRLPENEGRQLFRIFHENGDGLWAITPPLEVPAPGHRLVWQNGSLR